MWTVTVKTLDSLNHKFDNIDPSKTVAEFKATIASKVNVEAGRQRLIFCGRVLQDSKKISEYDVNGRVIHLVQRPPPGASQGPDRVAESEARASSRGPSPASRGRIEHIHVHSQDIPLPHILSPAHGGAIGQSSPLVRLNVAKEMLRQANRNLDRLDNPNRSSDTSDQSASRDGESATVASGSNAAHDTQMPPVGASSVGTGSNSNETIPPVDNPLSGGETSFSAGPIHIEMMSIPVTGEGMVTGGASPLGFAEALTAMFNGMGPSSGQTGGGSTRSMSFRMENGRYVSETGGSTAASSSSSSTSSDGTGSTGSRSTRSGTGNQEHQQAAEDASPSSSAAESNATGTTTDNDGLNEAGTGPAGMRIRHPPPEVLADVIEEYHRTNARLISHQNSLVPILRSDAAYSSEEEMNAHQQMFNDISQTTHLLSHAQHAMSDIMLNFFRPPPRQLRARLFVFPSMVHSARVQTVPIAMTIGSAGIGRTSTSSTARSSTTTPTSTSTASRSTASSGTQSNTTTTTTTTRVATSTAASGPINSGSATTTRSTTIPIPGGFGNASVIVNGPARRTATDDIQALVNSALQQALRSIPTISNTSHANTTTGSSSSGSSTVGGNGSANSNTDFGPSRQPLSPQVSPPAVGNLNSFDPFLPCSSHHIPSNRSPLGGSVTIRNQRPTRSGPSSGAASRTSSLDRRSTLGRPRPGPTQGSTWISPDQSSNTASASPIRPTTTSQSQVPPLQTAIAPEISVNVSLTGRQSSAVNHDMNPVNGLLAQMLAEGPPGLAPSPEDVNALNMIQGFLGQISALTAGGSGGGEGSVRHQPQTIAQFLNSLPDYNYVAGESLFRDLLMTLAQHVSFSDLIGLIESNERSVGGLQQPLQDFVRERVLQGADPTRSNLQSSLTHVMDQLYSQLEEAMSVVNSREEINYAETAHRFLSERPLDLLYMIMEEDNSAFQSRIGPLVRQIMAEGTTLSLHCFTDGLDSLERLVENRLGAMASDVGPMQRQWTMGLALPYLHSFVTGMQVEMDVDRYIVHRNSANVYANARQARLAMRASPAAAATASSQPKSEAGPAQASTNPKAEKEEEPHPTKLTEAGPPNDEVMEVDATLQEEAVNASEQAEDVSMVPVVLPAVPVIPEAINAPTAFPTALLNIPPLAEDDQQEPEGWQGAVPAQWVPIISRDSRQSAPRPVPFSDAYMSGQPPKRRRLNDDKKPRGDAKNFISDTIQEAVEHTGLAPTRGLESLLSAAASSTILQTAVENRTSNNIQERLENDPDFNPEKFPAAKKFIRKNK